MARVEQSPKIIVVVELKIAFAIFLTLCYWTTVASDLTQVWASLRSKRRCP